LLWQYKVFQLSYFHHWLHEQLNDDRSLRKFNYETLQRQPVPNICLRTGIINFFVSFLFINTKLYLV
jgi:hypothetical protein